MIDQTPTQPFLDFVLRHARVKTNVCTLQRSERGFSLKPRTVPDYNLIYVTRGRFMWVIEGVDVELSPGVLVIVPPGVLHHAYGMTNRVTLGSIHVEVTLPGGQDAFDLLVPAQRREVEPGSRLDQYYRGAIEEWSRNDVDTTLAMLPAWAQLIVPELIRYDAAHGLLRQRPIDPVVAAVLDELNRRIDRPVSLVELGKLSGFSPQHLNRVFHKVLGVTPLKYLTRMKLERAATLLADGRLTIRAVARQLGYDDAYYFSRTFHQHFGRSPSEYRDAAGSNSPSPRSPDPLPAGGRTR